MPGGIRVTAPRAGGSEQHPVPSEQEPDHHRGTYYRGDRIDGQDVGRIGHLGHGIANQHQDGPVEQYPGHELPVVGSTKQLPGEVGYGQADKGNGPRKSRNPAGQQARGQ